MNDKKVEPEWFTGRPKVDGLYFVEYKREHKTILDPETHETFKMNGSVYGLETFWKGMEWWFRDNVERWKFLLEKHYD